MCTGGTWIKRFTPYLERCGTPETGDAMETGLNHSAAAAQERVVATRVSVARPGLTAKFFSLSLIVVVPIAFWLFVFHAIAWMAGGGVPLWLSVGLVVVASAILVPVWAIFNLASTDHNP